jgi:signal transduction histidine kinase
VRLPIKVKSALALSVPLVILLGVAGLEVARSSRAVRDMRDQTDLATAAIGPSGLITAIQNERNYTGVWLLGSEAIVDFPVDSVEEARAATDDAAAAFRSEVERKGGDVARTLGPALAALDAEGGLADQRELVDGFEGDRVVNQYNEVADQSFLGYTRLVEALTEPTSRLTSGVDDEVLRRGVQLIDLASRELDGIANGVRYCIVAAVTGDRRISSREEIREASIFQSEFDRGHLQIIELSTGVYEPLGEELAVESDATNVRRIMWRLVRTGEVPLIELLEGISLEDDESYYGFLTDVSEVLRDRADELNGAAEDRQTQFIVLAALVLVVGAVATPLTTRSITRPLRSLTRQAKELAERRLPTAVHEVQEAPLGDDLTTPDVVPVRIAARDEVADVAQMLNQVQSTAIELAVGQAVLRRNVADALVNLARRNQNLLSRQLNFITDLETHETSPDTLANLFRLDHLATRMRRNAESLLVLAGVEARRHSTAPAPLVDVIRAALGEIDEFQRVVFRNVQPATITGPAIADLAHLLAELIENALRFSPPDSTVEIRGQSYTSERAYLLSVIDGGVGMVPEEIDLANRRLAQAEDFTIAPSRYLGHYVTAALAARHGIAVSLQASPVTGVTALVQLPLDLLIGRRVGRTAPASSQDDRPAMGMA